MACAMVMCAAEASTGGDCSGLTDQLKSIVGFDHDGDFDCSKTIEERLEQLTKCDDSRDEDIQRASDNIGCDR